jgi:2-methylisocitrate lyase-like PEP mutase family enzyme
MLPVFGQGESMRAGQKLRVDVRSSRITSLIGVFDMFSASLAAQHYGGMFVSGFGFAAS